MTKIQDHIFDQNLTLRQSFLVLIEFLDQFNERCPQGTDDLANWIALEKDGSSSDPAQLEDFLGCARKVIGSGT